MAIQHSVISDPNIHEPKGISTAPADSVYMANGVGSGTWVDKSTLGPSRGRGVFSNITLSAGPISLVQDTPYQLTQWVLDEASQGDFTLTNGVLTFNTAGVYKQTVIVRVSPVTTLTNSNESINVGFLVDGSPLPETTPITVVRNSDSTDVAFAVFSGTSSLVGGTNLAVTLTNTAAARSYNITATWDTLGVTT